jgi:hypothetical protein
MMKPVDLPSQSNVEKRLFALLKSMARPRDAKFFYEQLAGDFKLALVQTRAKTENGELAWHNRVRQAKRALVNAGLVDDAATSGHWSLTSKGRRTAKWPLKKADWDLDD